MASSAGMTAVPAAAVLIAVALAFVGAPGVAAEPELAPLVRAAIAGDGEALAAIRRAAGEGDLGAQLALASMRINGLGVEPDRRAGFGWLCLAAHHDRISEPVVHATWLLAEWFRTGGGLAERHYEGRSREHEDPMRAYFWYSVLARMGARDVEAGDRAAQLGGLGQRSVGSMLFAPEREEMAAAAAAWQPWTRPADGETCLALPGDPP